MKKTAFILLGIAILIAGYYIVKSNIEPSFSAEKIDHITKRIEFIFDGITSIADLTGGMSIVSKHNKKYVAVTQIKDGEVYIDLYKEGLFVKHLATTKQ